MSDITVDNALIERVVTDYSDMLFRLSYQRLRKKEAAEDIVQDTFLKFIKAKGFSSMEHIKAWLIRVAINLCLDHLKSPKNRCEELLDNRIAAPEPRDLVFMDELSVLSDSEKDVIYLVYYEGYQAKEAAKILKKSENAVYIMLNKARNKLKTYLVEENYREK